MRFAEAAFTFFLMMYNMYVFSMYRFDKKQARKRNGTRVPERTLLLLTACFGGLGAYAGMKIYHHKTKKRQFRTLVPLFCVLQCILLVAWVAYRILEYKGV